MSIDNIPRNTNDVNAYAIYLRKSRADIEAEALGEGETLARHRKILNELARRRGLNVVKTYEEIVSGESLEARTQMQQLLQDVSARMYHGVIVVDIDRLGRGDTKEQGIIAEAFQYSDTWIITPTKDFNPNDENDLRTIELGQFIARMEYRQIRKRLQNGLHQSVVEGNHTCKAPYGYEKVYLDKGRTKTLEINEDEARIVRWIFGRFADGANVGQIARELTNMHVPTSAGKAEWSSAAVRDILRNPVYIGQIRWKDRETVTTLGDGYTRIKRKRHSHKPEVYEGKHPAIVSDEIFAKCAARFANRPPAIKIGYKLSNPLSGIVKCRECGKSMRLVYSSQSNRKPRIAHPPSQLCKCKSIAMHKLLNDISDRLRVEIDNFIIDAKDDSIGRSIALHEQSIATMESSLKALEKRLGRLYELFETEVYTQQEFMQRRSALQAEIADLKSNLESAKSTAPMHIDYQTKIAQWTDICNAITDEAVEPETKNRLLKSIIEKCVYWKEPTSTRSDYELTIHFK